MDILAIDPSLACTGIAKREGGRISVDRVKSAPVERARRSLATEHGRIRWTVRRILAFAPAACLTVIESPAFARGGMAGAFVDRCGLYFVLVDQFLARGPVVEVAPANRARYATGSGKASKRLVLHSIRRSYPDLRIRDDNEADALALLGMACRAFDEPIEHAPLSPRQVGAAFVPAWPVKGKEAVA